MARQPIIESQHGEDSVYLASIWYMLGAWLNASHAFPNLILTSLWVVLFTSETMEGQD